MSSLGITSHIMSLCFLIWNNQTHPFFIVYSSFPKKEIRVISSFIYLTLGITAYFSVMGCFMVSSEIVRNRFQTHTFTISSCAFHNLFGLLITEQTGLQMHYFCAYLSALHWIMFNFYSVQCCDMRPFCKWNPASSLFAESNEWWSTRYLFHSGLEHSIFFLMHDTKQVATHVQEKSSVCGRQTLDILDLSWCKSNIF